MSQVLDFLISMLLVFLFLSTIASSLQEYWSSRIGRNTRAVMLFEALLKVFQDRHNRNFTDDLYRHPLIEAAKRDDNHLPAYIEATTFSHVLTDVFIREGRRTKIEYRDGKPVVVEPHADPAAAYDLFSQAVNDLHNSDVKKLLQSFVSSSSDLPSARAQIEKWYDTYMDRVTGWYKKRIKKELFWVSLVVAIFLNADLFRIASSVWNDEKLRSTLVNQAATVVSDSTWLKACDELDGDQRIQCLKMHSDSLYNDLKLTGLPLGWKSELPVKETEALKNRYGSQESWWAEVKYKTMYFLKLIEHNFDLYFSLATLWGWVLMAFALKQGAPFWFEALNKLINIRGSGARPAGKPK